MKIVKIKKNVYLCSTKFCRDQMAGLDIAESRTKKSVKNSTVALIFYCINLFLQFFSRKIFLDQLGAEVLGLNTTAINLLQFLNLAELGIGPAIACTLYKPLFLKQTNTINEIVSLQGWMYRRIAYIVIIAAIVLMCFFPLIFAKMPLPMWYAYASFGALLLSALLSYFVNYKQVVLSADQKEYKIQYSYKASMAIKVLCQIIAIRYMDNGYVWWLALEVAFAVIGAISLNWIIHQTYPYLHTDVASARSIRHKYPDILIKIKQLFFHKIGSFALTQTSPIIIYAYASLTLVALYGNYMLIITGVTALLGAVFNSMNAGVGNLIAEGNKQRIKDIFGELFSVRFLFTCIVCFCVYILTPAFVTLWLGREYLLDTTTLILMIGIMYISLSRLTVDAYLNAYGLFHDIWAPITEACINISTSILLGYFFGIHGILSGILLSLLLIIFCWKPYFLFHTGFKEGILSYVWMYAKHLSAATLAFIVTYLIFKQVQVAPGASWSALFACGFIYISTFTLILAVLLYAVSSGMRNFILRFLFLVHLYKTKTT